MMRFDSRDTKPSHTLSGAAAMYLYQSIPSWSHDGKWIYFQSATARAATNWKNALGERVFRCPASGGDAAALCAESGFFPWESYDGKTLYFADQSEKSSIHMVSVQPAGTESVPRG